jgi:hypothetical protein
VEEAAKANFSPTKIWRAAKNIRNIGRHSLTELQKKRDNSLAKFLGMPTFVENSFDYTQDEVIPLSVYLGGHNTSDNLRMIAQFPSLLVALWSCGIGDSVYNFTINTGVNRFQNLIQIDLGEFVFEKEKVAKDITEKKWLKQWSYTSLKDEKLKEGFARVMDQYITLENLKKFWGKLGV